MLSWTRIDVWCSVLRMTALLLNVVNDPAITFAGVTCPRCGGSGRLERFGHVMRGICFMCRGSGSKWTAAGRAAYATYVALLEEATVTKAAWQVEIGDRIETRPAGTFETVLGVRFDSRTGGIVDDRCVGSVLISTRPGYVDVRALDGTVTVEPTDGILARIRAEVKRRHRKGAS